MSYDYKILTQDEQDDIIVAFFLSQERDKYCNELNLTRYSDMLKTLKGGEWKQKVSKLRDDTVSRLAETNSIIEATKDQLPPPERIELSKSRITERSK